MRTNAKQKFKPAFWEIAVGEIDKPLLKCNDVSIKALLQAWLGSE